MPDILVCISLCESFYTPCKVEVDDNYYVPLLQSCLWFSNRLTLSAMHIDRNFRIM